MASAALGIVVLWQRSPLFVTALVGPLLTISLYQRSTHRELKAIRLALTDPPGWGSATTATSRSDSGESSTTRRSKDAGFALPLRRRRLQADERPARPSGRRQRPDARRAASSGRRGLPARRRRIRAPASGHRRATGARDGPLVRRAHRRSRADGAARPGVRERGPRDLPQSGRHARRADPFADGALYWAKAHGKNQVRAYRPDVVELRISAHSRRRRSGAARYRAAASLIEAVEAGDDGDVVAPVTDLATRAAGASGLDREQIELKRLAVRLRDLRQARRARRAPHEARRAQRGRATRDRAASTDRPAHPRSARHRHGRPLRCTTTSAGTDAARTGSRARRSRSARGSSSWRTRSRR